MKKSAHLVLAVALAAGCKGGPTGPNVPRTPVPPVPTTNPCDGGNADPKTRLFWAALCATPITRLDLIDNIDRVNDALTFATISNVDEICDVLTKPQVGQVCDDAEAAFMSLLINLGDGRLQDCTCLSVPGLDTVAKAALVMDLLLLNPARTQLQCAEVLGIAAGINSGFLLDSCASSSPTPTPSPSGSPTPTGSPTPPPPPVPPVPAGCSKGGAVIVVAPGGSIAAALASAKNGDIVVVADGNYPGSVDIGKNKVTLVAQNRGAATIGGSVTMSFNNECLVGFQVDGDVAVLHNNNTVSDNAIRGSVTVSKNNALIAGNRIRGSVNLSGNNNNVTGNQIGGGINDSGKNNNTTGNF